MLALLRLPRPPLARSSRVPPSPLRPPPARLAALPATVPGWVGPLSGGGGVRVLDLPLPPTGMLAALGLAIRRPSPPSPPFAPDRSLSPPFAARAVLHAFIQSRASGHGLCAPSPLMGIASVTSQITDHSKMPSSEEGLAFADSQVSIHLLRRGLREPHSLAGHPHEQLVISTVAKMVRRANQGIRTRILKVKAHSGIIGNEKADKAAKAAAQPDAEHDYETPAHKPFAGQWRPSFLEPPAAPHEGADVQGPTVPRAVANLNATLRKAVHASTKTGTSAKGVYASATEEMYTGREGDRALRQESNAMWRNQQADMGAMLTGGIYKGSKSSKFALEAALNRYGVEEHIPGIYLGYS